MITKTVTCYQFRLNYLGRDDLPLEVTDALYEAGCDDALVGIQGGYLFLGFSREASSFQDALSSAIADVERAGLGLQLVRVDNE